MKLPTKSHLKKLLKDETTHSYELNNMSKAYDKSLDRIALLQTMLKSGIYQKKNTSVNIGRKRFKV